MVFTQGNIIAMTVVIAGWVAVTLQWILHKRHLPPECGAPPQRDPSSYLFLAVQSLAIVIAFIGFSGVSNDFGASGTLVEAGAVTLLVVGALLLNMSALKTLGANFAIIARVREGGTLVTNGPYAHIRNPIYLCYLLLLVAAALAFGHPLNLLVAVPLYLIGTALRIAPEERQLRDRFGAEYASYAGRVKRLIPYVW